VTVRELLAQLRTLDIRITSSGDRLRLSAPPGALTRHLREEIQYWKPEILTILRLAGPPSGGSALIPMRVGGSKEPVFVIPGHNGDVFCYLPMLRHLSPEQPVLALQPPGLEDHEEPVNTVGELARRFTDDILRSFPSDSYRVAGYCMGGVTAFEVAALLRSRGYNVPVCALFGTSCPTVYWRRYGLVTAYQEFAERVRRISERRTRREVLRHLMKKLMARGAPSVGQPQVPGASERSVRLQAATIAAVRRYTPSTFDGRVTLYLPSSGPSGDLGRKRDWERFASAGAGVVTGPVGCTGDSMLLEPHIAFFGPRFQAELDGASAMARRSPL
jgi:thioesterase domain-containing protein